MYTVIKPSTWSRSINIGGWYSLAGLGATQQLFIGFKRLKWQADL